MYNLCNISYHHASLHKKQSPQTLPANFIAPKLKDHAQNTPSTQSTLTSNASPQQEKSPRSSSFPPLELVLQGQRHLPHPIQSTK